MWVGSEHGHGTLIRKGTTKVPTVMHVLDLLDVIGFTTYRK